MKNLLFFMLSVFAFDIPMCHSQVPSTWNSSYDPSYAPITKKSLSTVMRRNSKNAVLLLQLIEKSQTFKYGDVAFKTLDSMRQQYPTNAEVQAVYCWAYLQQIDTAYVKGGDYRERAKIEQSSFESALSQSRKISPNNWLLVFIDGYRNYAGGVEDWQKALPLLERATILAPQDKYARAFCWTYYGSALNLAAMRTKVTYYKDKPVTHQRAVQALETAAKIDPRQTSTWLTLFSIYQDDLPSRQDAIRAKRGFLRALPPQRRAKLPKWIKQSLARYPD